MKEKNSSLIHPTDQGLKIKSVLLYRPVLHQNISMRAPTENWTDYLIKKVWSSAKNYARSMGLIDECEDFAQIATMELLGGRRASVQQIYIDYLRRKLGRSNRKNELNFSLSSVEDIEKKIEDSILFDDLVGKLKRRDRNIYILYYRWGLYEREVAQIIGISESRVSQILKAGHKKMKTELYKCM